MRSHAPWRAYGQCSRCGAEAGQPCRDRRRSRPYAAVLGETPYASRPHQGRPLRIDLTSAGHGRGIARRAGGRAWAGPVPNHAVAEGSLLLCTGGPALAGHNGGGSDCPACLRLIADQYAEEA